MEDIIQNSEVTSVNIVNNVKNKNNVHKKDERNLQIFVLSLSFEDRL